MRRYVEGDVYLNINIREIKHDVYGKRQDQISFLPKHGET